jgi:cytochrome P450
VAEPQPPGPTGLPFFGTLIPNLRYPIRTAMRNYRRYGNVVRINFMGFHGAVLHGAAANRFILVDGLDHFVVEPLYERAGAKWLIGEGVLFIDDPAHRQQRKLIMPAFHRKRIEEYQRIMRDATTQVLSEWTPGAPLNIAAEMRRLALIVVGRALFNRDLAGAAQTLGDAVAVLVQTVNDPFRIAFARLPFDVPGVGYGASVRRAQHQIHTALAEIIAEHERSGADTGDVVSMLVAARDEEGRGLTPAQMRDHLVTLFVAGHETSANALAWTCYLLAQHPAVTTKLLAEVDGVLHGADPLPADLERLPYLEQVVKEALRLYPPAFSLTRMVAKPFEWEGYTLTEGDIVTYSPFVSHHIPTQFAEPETFNPDRFDPDHGEEHPPYAFIPFGGGPRSCIGAPFAMMEIKTVLAMLVQRYRLDLVPGQEIEAVVRTTLQPRSGILMRPQPQDGQAARSPAAVRGNVVAATPGPP